MRPSGACVVAWVPSLAGLDLFHFRLPGTAVPGFPVPPLRGYCVARSTLSNRRQAITQIPQELKPAFFAALCGTAEAVPSPNPIFETNPNN